MLLLHGPVLFFAAARALPQNPTPHLSLALAGLLAAAVPAAAQGDFNGDGVDDLAYGVEFEDVPYGFPSNLVNGGEAGILYGNNSFLGLVGGSSVSVASSSFAPHFIENGHENFGAAVAMGNFDGDLYDDLAIGVPGENRGFVVILYGRAQGLSTFYSDVIDGDDLAFAGVSLLRFGDALATGDFDGDGHDDLAVGAPDSTVNGDARAGAVVELLSRGKGLSTSSTARVWHQDGGGSFTPIQDVTEANDFFGRFLETGDFDDDGRDDLAVGIPEENVGILTDAGAIAVLFGNAGGLTALGNQFLHLDSPGVAGVASAGDRFGASLAAGEMNSGDDFADLAVGAPFRTAEGIPDAGEVYVFFGGPAGLSTSGEQVWNQGLGPLGLPTDPEPLDEFGAALASGDFDGDGDDDLAIGVPGQSLSWFSWHQYGVVHVLYSGTTGPAFGGSEYWHQDTPGIKGTAENGDRFGAALTAGNFNGGVGPEDLVVGAPDEDYSSVVNAGAIHVIYGSSQGLSTSYDQVFYQSSGNVSGKSETYDRFGRALGR